MASKNNKVNGGFMVLLGKRVGDSVFMPILCQTTLSLGRQLNTIDASSKCGKDIAIDEEDGTVTMEGFMLKAGLTDILTSKDVEDLYKTQDEADFMIGVVDPAGKSGLTSYRFSGMITQKQLNMNNNEKGKSSITITTTTPVETGVILPSGAILWDSDAKASGYTFDWGTFLSALDADLPASYQAEAELLLAPGITKTGMIAGVNKSGSIISIPFSRAGAATFIDKNGIMQTAAANTPRIDYSDGAARYLIEAPSTNLIQYSRALNNAYWNKTNVAAIDNSVAGRDGTLSASKLTITAAGSTLLYQNTNIPVVAGDVITLSFFAKKGTKISGYVYRVVDADTPATIIQNDVDYSTLINTDKWVKVASTFTVPSGTINLRVYLQRNATDTVGTFFVTDLQVEKLGNSTSTIVTNGASATRAADTVASTADLLNYIQGAIFINSTYKVGVGSTSAYLISKGSNTRFFFSSSLASMSAFDGTGSSVVVNTNKKFLTTYDATNLKIANGGVLGNSLVYNHANIPGSGPLLFNTGGSGQISMALGCLAIFSRAMLDTEAQTLTT